MVPLLNGIHLLYFGIGATALALNHDKTTSTPSLFNPAKTIRQTPTATSRKDVLQDPTFTLVSHATSTDDYPHVVLQSASDIARPSRAVTSLATGLSGVHIEPQSYSLNGSHPSAPTPGLRSQGSTGLPSYHAGVLSFHLPNGTTGPHLPVTTSATNNSTNSTIGLGHIIVAAEQAASDIENLATLLSGPTETMSSSRPQEEPQNALSVLLSALPSDVASSIEAGFRVVTQDLLATSNAATPRPTSISPDQITTSISRPDSRPTSSNKSERPTSRYTARPISDISASQSTRRPEKSHISSSNTSRPTSRPTTLTTRPSTTPTPTPSSTSTSTSASTTAAPTSTLTSNSATNPPPTAQDSSKNPEPSITPEQQNNNGTIAGIATGSAAAVVLLTLIVFFLLRRRRKQSALKALAAQNSQPYPEVAFLYDPVHSPPGSNSPAPLIGGADGGLGAGGGATEAGGVVGSRRESAMTQAQRSSLLAPEVVVVMPEGQHLLAPERAASRESSPIGMGRAR